jgi:regulatory protein
MEEKKKKLKITDPVQALEKAKGWCAYQERSQQEMRDKLYEWGLWKDAVESIIAELITSNFINEERFAKAYAGGKFRIKKWGKVKIRIELKRKGVTEYCIRKGLQEIDGDEYEKALYKIIEERARVTRDRNVLKRNYKIAQYAISRGYEPQLVWDALKMEAPGE